MQEIIREFFQMVKTKNGRRTLAYSLVMDAPGRLGVLLRRKVLAGVFAQVGENLGIRQGVYFRNPQNISIGDNVDIGNHSMLQAGGGITIGNDVLLGPGVKLWTQSHSYRDVLIPIRMQPNDYAPITIGDDCWIGSNVFIMPGVKLPRGCVVSAGSVVGIKAYKEYSVLMGNPARLLGIRGEVQVDSSRNIGNAEKTDS